jgi:hypothetical protein
MTIGHFAACVQQTPRFEVSVPTCFQNVARCFCLRLGDGVEAPLEGVQAESILQCREMDVAGARI